MIWIHYSALDHGTNGDNRRLNIIVDPGQLILPTGSRFVMCEEVQESQNSGRSEGALQVDFRSHFIFFGCVPRNPSRDRLKMMWSDNSLFFPTTVKSGEKKCRYPPRLYEVFGFRLKSGRTAPGSYSLRLVDSGSIVTCIVVLILIGYL